MVHGNSPYEPTLRCRYSSSFELAPVLLGTELGHWGYALGTSWAQVMLCSWSCSKFKVPKLPGLWGLAQTPRNLRKFHDESTLAHPHMHEPHQKPLPIDSAWWTAAENTLPPSQELHEDFWLKIPNGNLFMKEFPWSLEFQVPSFLSSHMSQCSSLSSFSSAARCASMHACMPMSIQLASKLHPHSDGSPNLFPSAVPITWELRGNGWEHGISCSSLDESPSSLMPSSASCCGHWVLTWAA